MMKKAIIVLLMVLLIAGCTTNSSSIKKLLDNPDKYIGKEVIVDGQVNNRFIKSGDPYISVVDADSYILVQSKFNLEKNQNVTVRGIFSGDKTTGYFIKSREVRVR